MKPAPEDPEIAAQREADEEKEQRIALWNSLPESERVRLAEWFAKQFKVALHPDPHTPTLDDDTAYDPITGNIYHINRTK